MNVTDVPYILSLAYKNQLDEACRGLKAIALDYFVMYIIFNDGSRFVLSNTYQQLIPYYTEGFYKEDFSYQSEIIAQRDYYLCDSTQSVSDKYKLALEERFGLHRVYYIVRKCMECTFVFGAIKGKQFGDCADIYKATFKDFNKFCLNFVDNFLEIIRDYNPSYKNSFILTNAKQRHAVIKGGYPASERLTEREKECLWWASKGKSTKEVAKLLGLSPTTVETHNKHIRRKLNCTTMIEAVVEGIHRGLIGRLNPEMKKSNKCQIEDFQIVGNMDATYKEIQMTNLALLNSI